MQLKTKAMRKNKKMVRLYLTVDKEFHSQLVKRAKSDYMKVATWTKQLLMKSLPDYNKQDCLTSNSNGTT